MVLGWVVGFVPAGWCLEEQEVSQNDVHAQSVPQNREQNLSCFPVQLFQNLESFKKWGQKKAKMRSHYISTTCYGHI